MTLQETVRYEFMEAQKVLQDFVNNNDHFFQIGKAVEMMAESLQSGGKILSCGNGGSHCDAMHFAEELTGRYRNNRRPLAALAISDPSHLSCVGNDFGYDHVFSRFVEGVGRPGDILLAISTSGQSDSIVNAITTARRQGIKTVILTGKDGGKLADIGDVEIRVPHFGYADRIQEIHIKIIHSLILGIEQLLIEQP
ncbi:D-sedoheptulose 7-phosphate isomerase [Runella sp.]|uniref:D-sedoheptulose 7-phosphate isomerase n=1 Tax=Runella sp. TaxID=1960881 RepID=UPI002609FF05|nr:D-sedoheptulose 7-phosphate isomerase [Runella sp.]